MSFIDVEDDGYHYIRAMSAIAMAFDPDEIEIEPGQPGAPEPAQQDYADSPGQRAASKSLTEDEEISHNFKDLKVYEDKDWHGYKVGDKSIHVGHLPGRKSVALYEIEGTVFSPLAYFKNEEDAQNMLNWLDRLVQVYAVTTFKGE